MMGWDSWAVEVIQIAVVGTAHGSRYHGIVVCVHHGPDSLNLKVEGIPLAV